ncbi:MAG: hypothetical protein IPJ79_11840 [Bacteroidetes bacterium]|nr:hypothetical protein [Bacteroidota bacterium]HNR19941.1 hypothetical protein [Bacteroidia bacterium]HNU32702.1 hypothetical protein [Bacteroidia bacterium]
MFIFIIPVQLLAQKADSTKVVQVGIDIGAGFGSGENFATITYYSVSFNKFIFQAQKLNFYKANQRERNENTSAMLGYRFHQNKSVILKGLLGVGTFRNMESYTSFNPSFEANLLLNKYFAFELKAELISHKKETLPYIGLGFRLGLLGYSAPKPKKKKL